MKLLVVAATEMEMAPFAAHSRADILVTGVGMTATTYALTKKLQAAQYDLVIQAGVAGCFSSSIVLCEPVFVTTDRYGDMGAEDHDKYLDAFDMGLIDKDAVPYTNGILATPMLPLHDHIRLRSVSGLTVNTVSGSENTIARRRQYGCDIESMEGAAFHYVCLREQVPFAQVRAISNYVTPRDKSQWKMKEAIINLNDWLIDFTGRL